MKSLALILCFYFISNTLIAQSNDENIVKPDFIIGEYGISLKNKTIGRYRIFDCSDEEYHAECFAYFKVDNIDYDTTSLIVIGNEFRFKEDLILDVSTIKIIDIGNSSKRDSQERDPIYIDKNDAYKGLHKNNLIDSLYGFKHLDQNYFFKNNSLAFLDQHAFRFLNDSNKIDKTTFKAITKNLFYDKNGVYYVEYGHSEVEGKKYSNYIKLQHLKPNQKPSILIKENYCVINGKVYDLNRFENELILNPTKIKELVLDDFSGAMLLYDDNTVYERSQKHYRFEKAMCDTEYEKTEIHCLFNDLSTARTLRKTGFLEYHLDLDKKTLYFDANKDLNLTETSGNLYKIGNSYYFTDNDRFSTQINNVKIWNPKINSYESIDVDNYHYFNNETYYYKGNLYGHHSELKQTNFSLLNARTLSTNNQSYIVNNEKIVGMVENEKLNFESIKVLRNKNNQVTNYLIGKDFLVYNNQIIKGVDTESIYILSNNIIKTKHFLINEGTKIPLDTFPFKIKIL